MKKQLIAALALSLFAFSCGSDSTTDYDPAWGDAQSVPNIGKGDFLDLAQPIKFGDTVTGSVNETQIEVYKLQLFRGDEITLNGKATTGDLVPDVSLFTKSGTSIGSDSFQVGNQEITKQYEIEATAEHIIVVRAFRNQGKGKYQMSPKCNGGPCNGEFIDPLTDLEEFEVVECVEKATECAFEVLPSKNGRVGKVTATKILGDCLSRTPTDFGETCQKACEVNEDAQQLCDIIIGALPFYADQDEACIDTLDTCMSDCTGFANSFSSDIFDSEFATCWASGLNSDCDIFARRMPECGGELSNETAICYEECHATIGSSVDDLGDICIDDCGACGIECMEQHWGEVFDNEKELLGDLVDTFIGEVDPFVFGDTCIYYIETFEASANANFPVGVYGVIDDNCSVSSRLDFGSAVTAFNDDLEKLTDADELNAVDKLETAVYYKLVGGEIEEF